MPDLILEISDDLHERIVARAEANNRSLRDEVMTAICVGLDWPVEWDDDVEVVVGE